MALASLPSVRTRQPNSVVGANWEDELAGKVTHLIVASNLYDAVKRKPLLQFGTPGGLVASQGGVALKSPGSFNNGYSAPLDTAQINAGNPWTLAALVELRPDISGYSNYLICHSSSQAAASGAYDRGLGFTYVSGYLYAVGTTYDGATKTATGATAFDFSNRNILVPVVVTCGGGTLTVYVNGASDGTVAVSANGYTGYSGSTYLNIGTCASGESVTNFRIQHVVKADNRVWSKAEVLAWSSLPWRLLLEDDDHYVPPSAGGTSISVTDAGTGADAAPTVAVSFSLADAGAGAEAFSGSATVPTVDAGAGAETASVSAALSVADAGAGMESAPALLADVPVPDAGAGADAAPSVSASVPASDAGTGTDAPSVLASLLVADAGAGADALGTVTVAFTVTDAGTGAEVVALTTVVPVQDAGAGVDAVSVAGGGLVSVIDSGVGAEALSIAVAATIADTASALEAPSIAALLALADAGVGVSACAVTVNVTIADLGTGADALSVLQSILIAVADAGTGLESLSAQVVVQLTEAGHAMEAMNLAAVIGLLDTGGAVEVIASYQTNKRVVMIRVVPLMRTAAVQLAVRRAVIILEH